ncbi:ABC transporter thiamine pyrophosphate-binding lipoprotein p37/Cypl [Mycoplasmopsis cynos]|uniref:ABC transporter thiamine pyrophosphate-binding lipoprotein p37/Cypl n=1 Tax=Mycoplasmopsis cynos TaxID=171284 RepID=UPI002AFE1F2F|nr:DNA repair protein [Mycoplasmopsis cynos]WQQ16068.1 DNA repair protein [Mycoplasmopsis cynos]
MKFKKLLFSSALLAPLIIASCSFSQGSEAKIVNIKLGNSLKDKNKQQEFEAEVNKLLKQRGSKFSVKFSFDGDTDAYQTNKDDILKGSQDLVFVSAGQVYANKKDIELSKIDLGIQTKTKAFKGSLNHNMDKYINGREEDPLRVLANEQEKLFKKFPRSEWNDKNEFSNGVYKAFYNDELTPYQRGLIVIVANENDTNGIIKAWNEKNLNEFINYGLGIGKKDSGSKYLLPEALLKKQFADKFTSLLELSTNKNYQDKIKETKWSKMNDESFKDIKIFFDNEGVYAYSKFKPGKFDPYTINSSKRSGQKITFLTVTDVLPYNIGLYNSAKITKEEIKKLAEVFESLAKNGKDPWGPLNGFNGYGYIEDPKNEFWDVVKQSLNK